MLRTRGQAPGDMRGKLLHRMGDISAGPTEREGGTNNQRQSKLGEHLRRVVRPGEAHTPRHHETNLLHDLLEEVAIFCLLDRCQFGADELDPIVLEHPCLSQGHREVEGRLTTHGRQEGLWSFTANDFFQHVWGERLQVRPIC